MNRLLIIAHAPLASALRDCALHVWPDCGRHMGVLDVLAQDSAEQSLQRLDAELVSLLAHAEVSGCLLLTDVLGATPCNVAQRWLDTSRTPAPLALIAGVNVPMLLRSLCYRHEPLPALCERAQEGAKNGVVLKFQTS
jgi:mannose PTS system EIIA component